MEWYQAELTDTIDSPALLIYPDRIRENIRRAVAMTGTPDRLYPHVKTVKMPAVIRLMMEEGITGFKCSTIAEAEMLAREGASNILYAMQPTGNKIPRLASLVKEFPNSRFSCLVDAATVATEISEYFLAEDQIAGIYIDLNVGMNRTGIYPGTDAFELLTFCSMLKGIRFYGFHAYDGHLRNPDVNERSLEAEAAFAPVQELREAAERSGYGYPSLIAGGSPSFAYHCMQPDRICSPGTFALWDYGYMINCTEQPFEPAAVVFSRVISIPGPDRVCLDLGHKSVAAENPPDQRVHFLNVPGMTMLSQSEEHLVAGVENAYDFKPGDIVYALPWHICPTVALYDQALVIQDHQPAAYWDIPARKRKLTI